MVIEFLTSKFFFLVTGLCAALAFTGMILYMNWSVGLSWKNDIWPAIKDDPEAVSRYFRARLYAVLMLIVVPLLASAIL